MEQESGNGDLLPTITCTHRIGNDMPIEIGDAFVQIEDRGSYLLLCPVCYKVIQAHVMEQLIKATLASGGMVNGRLPAFVMDNGQPLTPSQVDRLTQAAKSYEGHATGTIHIQVDASAEIKNEIYSYLKEVFEKYDSR